MDIPISTRNDIPRKKRSFLKLCLCVLLPLLLVTAYAVCCFFFYGHYFPYSYINGQDVSFMTPQEAYTAIAKPGTYTLSITGRNDLTDEITGNDIGLNYEIGQEFYEICPGQSAPLFFTALFYNSAYDVSYLTRYDADLLKLAVDDLDFFLPENIIAPENAYVGDYDKSLGEFPLIPEVNGARPLKQNLYTAVEECINADTETLILDDTNVYENPYVTTDEPFLINRYHDRNEYLKLQVTYDFGSGRKEVVDKDIVHDWLIIGHNSVSVDETLVSQYIDGLAEKYDTYGKDRMFTTINGEVKTFKKNHNRIGFKIDREAETQNLIQYIKDGTNTTTAPAFSNEGAVLAIDDIGDSYIEIDLAGQHLYAHIDGKVVLESDLVSGNVSKGHTTPDGAYSLTYRKKKAILRGDDYATPVNYWMPFNYGIGMHDATWRRTFGGSIYLTGGSHGCINMPLAKAKEMYDLVYTGIPVICYY